jgi:hypothetical protein
MLRTRRQSPWKSLPGENLNIFRYFNYNALLLFILFIYVLWVYLRV